MFFKRTSELYDAPAIEMLEVTVEAGFANSTGGSHEDFGYEDQEGDWE